MDTAPIPRKVTILVEYDDPHPDFEIEVPRDRPDGLVWSGWLGLGEARVEVNAEAAGEDEFDLQRVDSLLAREYGVKITVKTDKIAAVQRIDKESSGV